RGPGGAFAADGLRAARRDGHLRRGRRSGRRTMSLSLSPALNLSLDLLRHGETTHGGGFRGSLDDALTGQGWAQMRAATAGKGPWDLLVSSPLARCAAFAAELGAQRQLPVVLEADLRELHFGDWEGRSAAELMET